MENYRLGQGSGENLSRDRRKYAVRDLNAVLLAMAIGLAVLDLTGFLALGARNALPSHALPSGPAVANVPAPGAQPAKQKDLALAALAPTKPDAPLTGW